MPVMPTTVARALPPCTLQSIAQPGEFLMTDFSKFDRPALLHIAFHALDIFEVRRRHLKPSPKP